MAKFTAYFIAVCVALVVGFVVGQKQRNLQAESQIATVRHTLAPTPTLKPPTVQTMQLTNPAVTASNPEVDREVLKLRNEVSRLRAELASKTNAPRKIQVIYGGGLTEFQPTMEQDEVRQLLTFDSLKDAGLKTPESAVETYLFTKRLTLDKATHQAASDRLTQIVFTPPGAKFGGLGANVQDDPLRDSKILKIEAVAYPTADTAEVLVNWYDDNSGYRSGATTKLVRDGDEWKIDLGLRGQ